jgi:hypothetical protein
MSQIVEQPNLSLARLQLYFRQNYAAQNLLLSQCWPVECCLRLSLQLETETEEGAVQHRCNVSSTFQTPIKPFPYPPIDTRLSNISKINHWSVRTVTFVLLQSGCA